MAEGNERCLQADTGDWQRRSKKYNFFMLARDRRAWPRRSWRMWRTAHSRRTRRVAGQQPSKTSDSVYTQPLYETLARLPLKTRAPLLRPELVVLVVLSKDTPIRRQFNRPVPALI